MAIAIVQGVFSVRPEERDRFIEQSLDGMRFARGEDGCLEYAFAADPLDPGRVILSERWESMEALNRHLQGFASRQSGQAGEGGEAGEAGSRVAPLDRQIEVYEVASSKPLG